MADPKKIGDLLREWRNRRRLSQLDLAYDAGISPKHLSFVETGRAHPSREMVLHLAEQMEIPLRERNVLLASAGFAPVFAERPLDDSAMDVVRSAVDVILAGHEPNPAIAIDRRWNLHASNKATRLLMDLIDDSLHQPPHNVLRACFHPLGLSRRMVNYHEWRASIFGHLERQVDVTGDQQLFELLKELREYPAPAGSSREAYRTGLGALPIAVPLRIRTAAGELSFLSVTTVFGTPAEITVEELAIESFFPADKVTADFLNKTQF